MPPSEAIEGHIRENALKLDSFYERITGCRVLIEAPHRHHHNGKLYHVRIDMTVPGGEIVVKREPKRLKETAQRLEKVATVDWKESHEPSKYAAHEDVYVAIRDAFDAARRKLQDFARRQRGAVKIHEPVTHARVTRLFPEEGFGFLETSDGREIYFHKNSVLEPGFGHLKLGTAVYFAEEQGREGPQATTIRLSGRLHLSIDALNQ